MAQAVSRRSVTAEARVHARGSSCEFCGGQSGTGIGFSQNSSVSLSISFHRGPPYSHHVRDEQ
jgi:hypothetical protein